LATEGEAMTRKAITLQQNISLDYDYTDKTEKHVWVVKKVVNSTYPNVGQGLNRQEVDAMCDDDEWQVTIV
tara:strand:+ start:415 stop:627 length:213 start_codon:yes stop_codon:yes gene_type:complete